jgi:hypothetical protein
MQLPFPFSLVSVVSSFRVSFTSHYPTPSFLQLSYGMQYTVLAITFPQGSYLPPLYTHVSVLRLIVSVHALKLCRFRKFCHQSEVNHITDQSPTCVCKLETIQPQFHLTDFRLLVSTEQLCRPTYTAACLLLSVRKCNLLNTGVALRRQY